MTREQAIGNLRHAIHWNDMPTKEALDMAIEALKAEPCEDAISRQAAKQAIRERFPDLCERIEINSVLNGLPSVQPISRWVPITYRPMTDEEKKDYAERTGYDEEDLCDMLACNLPDDGETVLITDRFGGVEVDTFYNDCGECYFECNCDMDDVKAWMPLPKPYDGADMREEADNG